MRETFSSFTESEIYYDLPANGSNTGKKQRKFLYLLTLNRNILRFTPYVVIVKRRKQYLSKIVLRLRISRPFWFFYKDVDTFSFPKKINIWVGAIYCMEN